MTTPPPTLELPKPTPEVFQFLVRYSDIAKTKIDLHDVAKTMSPTTKYKAAWDGIDKARKHLASVGYVAPVPAPTAETDVTTPTKKSGSGGGGEGSGGSAGKKRKDDGEGETQAGEEVTPKKKARKAKVKKEVQESGDAVGDPWSKDGESDVKEEVTGEL